MNIIEKIDSILNEGKIPFKKNWDVGNLLSYIDET